MSGEGKMKTVTGGWLAAALSVAVCAATAARSEAEPKMATAIPPAITTPDAIHTRLGTLRFFDGYPDADTARKAYDNLDFMRGVQVFLNTMPGASLYAMREGLKSVGVNNSTVAISETLMDARTVFLTPNTETVYVVGWLDLREGPLVVETPPNILGFLDDFWFRYIIDMGNAGPDRGKGGKFLVLPPGYTGEVPDGYFAARSRTYGVWLAARGFLAKRDPKPAVASFKKHLRVYPLAQAVNPPETHFVDISGKAFNTVHANNAKFFEEVNHIVQEEPNAAQDPEILGLLASIGIVKGKRFAPDERMRKILDDAAAVGNATARAIVFAPRLEGAYLYPGSQWQAGFIGGSHEFARGGARLLDARVRMFYYATGITPAMAAKTVGVGSQYALVFRDAGGNRLDGAKTYRLRIPARPPAKNFWSIVVYDNQTRSELQTDRRFPSIGSQKPGLKKNADGSVDLYFGPAAPRGKAANWVQTVPGKGWNAILRLYGALEPWFDKSWRPGELEEMPGVPPEASTKPLKMATPIPSDILTPDRVETRIGTLEFLDGFPTEATTEKVYDHLDFTRGVEAFLSTMTGAAQDAVRAGLDQVGAAHGTLGVFETLMDSKTLALTPNTETIYAFSWLDLKNGPIVVEVPANVLGMVNDFWYRYVTDVGLAGPDRGNGGKFLFLPPDHEGDIPPGYFTYKSSTYGNSFFVRGFMAKGDPGPGAKNLRDGVRIYRLAQASDPPEQRFVNLSGRAFDMIHANDSTFYVEVGHVVQEEPGVAQNPELLGLLAAIGIEKNRPFAPDARMQRLLTEAAAVGNATARAIAFATRDEEAYLHPDSWWKVGLIGGSHEFQRNGVRLLDGRTLFHYIAGGVTPAMAVKMVGVGSQYAYTERDGAGNYLDGAKSYALRIPADVPAKTFWSVVVYDPQTRSMLRTDHPFPSLSSQTGELAANADGSVDVYFGPEAPAGKESNWVQTVRGKGWFVILRLYAPLEPWFAKTWRPGEVEEMK
jgi:hypothetical protein